MDDTEEGEIYAYEPEQALLKLIGINVELNKIFTEERIVSCQQTIEESKTSFFEEASEEIARLQGMIGKQSGGYYDEAAIKDIAALAGNIKGHAVLFGFDLITTICGNIIETCETHKFSDAARSKLIADLARMLNLAIKDKITDPKGELGQKLVAVIGKG